MKCLGLRVAEAFAVGVGADFAAGLTAQHGFDPAVQPGKHWGTRLITDAVPATLEQEDFEDLRAPADLFTIYLVDVLCAYRDRQTFGNVLLIPLPGGKRADVLPIDQSDCFGGPDCLCDSASLEAAAAKSFAQPFNGMERVVLEGGASLVDGARDRVMAARACILAAPEAAEEEWYERARVDPGALQRFLAARLDDFETLARLAHWRGMAAAAGDNYALF